MDANAVLNEVRIASPCPVPWSEMKGDDRVRFCGSCERQVYNVSALTSDEALALLRKTGGKVCLQIYRRRDGTVLTADCPVGARAAAARRLGRLWRIAAVVTGLWAIESAFRVTERRDHSALGGAWSKALEAQARLLGAFPWPRSSGARCNPATVGELAPLPPVGTPLAAPRPLVERGEPDVVPAFGPTLLQETLGEH